MKKLIILFTVSSFFSPLFSQFGDLNKDVQMLSALKVMDNSRITYLFFKVEKTSSGSEKITLQEKKSVPGKLKANTVSEENNGGIGDFVVSVTDAGGKEITKQIIEDPLHPTREVYGEDISRNKISLEAAEFSIRYSHTEEAQMLKIEKITEAGIQPVLTQRL